MAFSSGLDRQLHDAIRFEPNTKHSPVADDPYELAQVRTNKMIRNYYYLVAGILSIIFSVTHAWNGQTNFLPTIDVSDLDLTTRTTTFYIWHILTAENFIFGIAFLVMSACKAPSTVRFSAWIIAFVVITRWVVIFGSTFLRNRSGLGGTLVDSIAIGVFVAIILLGARKKL